MIGEMAKQIKLGRTLYRGHNKEMDTAKIRNSARPSKQNRALIYARE